MRTSRKALFSMISLLVVAMPAMICKRKSNSKGAADMTSDAGADSPGSKSSNPSSPSDPNSNTPIDPVVEKNMNPEVGEVVTDLPTNPGTRINGGVIAQTRWTAAGSPYHILGDITLPDGATLAIDPGVTVIFDGAYKFSVIGGSLQLAGTLEQPIRFTAAQKNPGWYGILFCPDPTCTSSVNKGSIDARFTIFEYARANDKEGDFRYWRRGGALLLLHTSSVKISSSVFRYNFAYEVGGGLELIAIDNSQTVQLDNILFLGNEAGSGGALRLSHIHNRSWSGLIFESNRVRNWPDSYGGAIEVEDASNITMTNTIASANLAEVGGRSTGIGGGFYCYTPGLILSPPYELSNNSPEHSVGCGQETEFNNQQGKSGQVNRMVPAY
ncbi:MAG TPA: hypothetical protein VE954_21205 [Oligoflexus sp.]|uniref:hypothetical protein n=1 Tax=Oligoflexus sp. TaxID=1971216 RepID=UPI002D4F4C73|nr:hypothetical protein [Oligoflexus sp.]HYX35623.1 hypothetical protein [Oligoflexus sp.]